MSHPAARLESRDAWDDPVAVASPADVSRIAIILDEYARLCELGRRPERGEFLARHATIAEELSECLDGLDLVLSAQGDLLASDLAEESSSEEFAPSGQLGDYRILREVGRGGMGVVYEAEQVPLGRRVALKVLPSAASLDARHRQRFQLEAQAVAQLQHEHIVSVYGVGCDQGVHYFAMQFIDGWSLAELIRELRGTEPTAPAVLPNQGRLPAGSARRDHAGTVAWYGVQAAEALQHAHEVGIIHRDVKPSNFMVDDRGHLWITDFGLAHLPQDDPSLTRTGDLVGTLRYMSPEQVRGARHEIDSATDIYALGLTLYELVTLRPAFVAADRQELLRRILQDEPVPPRRIDPSIPRDLETIVLKAIAKEPRSRYGSARELADDLGRFLEDQPILARRPSLKERAARWSRRHRPVVLTAVIVLVMALAIGTTLLRRAKQQTGAALDSHRQALVEERKGYEAAIAALDVATQPLTNPADGSGPVRGPEADRIYQFAIGQCDQIRNLTLDHKLVSELAAKAARRAGFFRMILGDAKGRGDYEQAIRAYETLIQQQPGFIWLHTGLIETLREYSERLSRIRDRDAAEAKFRHALRVAEGLVGNAAVEAPCFHKPLIEPVNGLAWDLVVRPPVDRSDATLAIRLARQVVEWENTKYPLLRPVHLAKRTLGVAAYRAGDWTAAAAALEQSMTENEGGDARDWFFLAIVRHRQGDRVGAQKWYERAASWMERNPAQARDGELARIRAEADEVFGRPALASGLKPGSP
jgi:serine/threonine protein kinase